MMLKVVDRYLGVTLRAIAMTCFAILFALLFINVVARTFQLAGFAWFDEIVQGLFAWMVFTGAAALWRENEHFAVNWLETQLQNPMWLKPLQVMISVLCIGFLLAMTIYGYDLFSKSSALTPILQLPTPLFYVVIPISGLVMIIYSIRNLVQTVSNSQITEGTNHNDL